MADQLDDDAFDFSAALDAAGQTDDAKQTQDYGQWVGLPNATWGAIDEAVESKRAQRQSVIPDALKDVLDPQQYIEGVKGQFPGAVNMIGGAAMAPDVVGYIGQQNAAKFGRSLPSAMDRIDRGETVPEMEDPTGYQHMTPEQRQAVRTDVAAASRAFNPSRIEDRPLYQTGEAIKKWGQGLMPAAPGYEQSVGRQIGEGLGSLYAGIPFALLGPAPAALFFGAGGVGEATERAVEFDRKERAAGREGLTQDQIVLAGIMGVGPGMTDALPVEMLMGRLPVPIPPGLRAPVARAIGRIGGQALIEGLQEGGQQFLQNLIAREVYNPDQTLMDGMAQNAGIGAGVGGIAQTAKELGSWMLRSAAVRRSHGHKPSGAPDPAAAPTATPEVAQPDSRDIVPASDGAAPPAASTAEARVPSTPAVTEAEALLNEIATPVDEAAPVTSPIAMPAPEAQRALPAPDRVEEIFPRVENQAAPETSSAPIELPAPAETAPPPPAPSETTPAAPDLTADGQNELLARVGAQIEAAAPGVTEAVSNVVARVQPRAVAQTRLRREPRPVSIIDFIRQRGGLRDEGGDLRAMDARRRPGLLNRNGLDLDRARELAVEAGYLAEVTDGNALTTSTADLLDLISEDLAGRRQYSQADADRVANLRGEADAAVADERTGAYIQEIADWHEVNGLSHDFSKRELERAALLMSEGATVDEAVERTIIESYNQDASDDLDTGRAPGASGEVARDGERDTVAVGESQAEPAGGDVRRAGGEGSVDDGARARFAQVLASKEKRSTWAQAAGVSEEQAQALIAEAVADGRLTIRNGAPIRLPKARVDLSPPADAYAVRAAHGLATDTAREHYGNLASVGVDADSFESAVAAIEADRTLTPGDRTSLAQAYIGAPIDGDPITAMTQAFRARLNQARLADVAGIPLETVGTNLRVRDGITDDVVVQRLEAMAARLPREAMLVIRRAIHLPIGDRVTGIEGLTTSPTNARDWFGVNPGAAERVLAISLEYGPEIAMQTLTHEEIHLLRELRALMGPEWKALEGIIQRRPKKAEAERIIKNRIARGQMEPEAGAELLKQAGQLNYRKLYQIDERYADIDGMTEERLVEETVAHVAADWADGRSFGSKVDAVMQKIRDLLETIGNAIRGLGFRSANDVFESIWAGEVVRQHEARVAEHVQAKADALEAMRENGIIALAIRKEPAAAIGEVWGTKFQTLMSQQYQIAVAGSDYATQYDILTAKYNNALSDPPEMRAAMKAEIDRLRPIVETQDAELRAELKRKFGALTDRTMFAIAGENAMGADIEALRRAERMEARGQSRERIWTQTGWYRGVDTKWRFEIDDSKARLRAIGPDKSMLPIELTHDALFDAYPQLIDVEFNRVPGRGGGYMNAGIRPSYMNVGKESRSRKSVTLHETQHAIQDVEGFAEGGSPSNFTAVEIAAEQARLQSLPQSNDWTSIDNIAPDDITSIRFNLYQRLAGEVEARMVQTRLAMTPEERKERAPWHDYDVPEAEQIVKMPDEFASLRSSIEETDQPRRSKEGYELQLPFRDRWGDPRFDAADRERAIARLKQIQTIKTMSASWADLNQAFDDIHAITANLLFYRPGADLSTMASRVGSDVGMYAFERKYGRGDLLHRRSLFSAEELPDEVQEFAQEGRAALEHLLRSRRAGISDLAGDESATDPRLKGERNPAAVGEKLQSGFYFKSARALDEVPDSIFPQGGWAVINHLRQAGVRKAEVDHFELAEKLGNQKPVTREAFQEAINDRAFDFRRKTSWLNPERSPRTYELGGTRAFTGPRVPGRGTYFERLVAFPKKLRGGETFAPGMFQSPHWEETHKGTWGSWRGSERELPGLGKTIVGEEGQSDYMQGALGRGDDWTGRRPRVTTDEYLGMKAERPKFEQANSDVESLLMVALRSLPYETRRDLVGRLKPSVMRDDATPEAWDEALAEARTLINTDERFTREPSRVLGELETLDRLVALRDANPDYFAPGAFEKYARTEQTFTPESPIDDNWVRTLVRDLMLLAAQRNADAIAISTSETTNRIQVNTTASAAHFYDGQLKTALERELRTVTGDGSIALESVTLPKAQGAPRNEKPFTVWAAKLPAGARAKIQSEGMTMFALRDWGRGRKGQTPPQATPQGEEIGLNKILVDLRKTLGLTVSQQLWTMTLRQRTENPDGTVTNRTVKARPSSKTRGQYDTQTGVVSIKEARDVKALAHEGGFHLETILGDPLTTTLQQHADELTGNSAATRAELSEAFARWFENFVLDPVTAAKTAPNFERAFKDTLESERADILLGLDTIQSEYQRYISTAPLDEVGTGIASQYDRTTFKALGEDALFDNWQGWLATGYQSVLDANAPARKAVKYLLETADKNGIVDPRDGRPISLATDQNFYKKLRMFGGSFNRGRQWLEAGVSDLVTGELTTPSLKRALEVALGDGRRDTKRYNDFNKYLIAQRAIAEYDLLDEKEAALARYDDIMARMDEARGGLVDELGKSRGFLSRREDALIRARALARDRRRALSSAETRLENASDRVDELRADIAEAEQAFELARDIDDPTATNAVNAEFRNLVARRRRSLQIAERDQQQALRGVERLSEEVQGRDIEETGLDAEVDQYGQRVDALTDRLRRVDEMRERMQAERDTRAKRGASAKPTAEPRIYHERVISELGSPEFEEGARLVHEFTFALLRARHQAGFISDEQFDLLSQRKDWYVPFFRDISDVPGMDSMRSRARFWSPYRKFNGSSRGILAPLESISAEAYNTAQQIAFNDIMRSMIGLAEFVGPGGGAIAQRLTRQEIVEANAANFDKIREQAIKLGMDPADATLMVQRAEMNFSDADIRVVFNPEAFGPAKEAQLPLWENGQRIMIRLPDPDFAKAVFEGVNAVGKEMADDIIGALAKPAAWLRVGVTSAPDFIGANAWRDLLAAYKYSGGIPGQRHVEGFRIMSGNGEVVGLSAEDFQRFYNETGGIAGGININAVTAHAQRDVKDILGTNIHKGAVLGGMAIGGAFGMGMFGALGLAGGWMVGGALMPALAGMAIAKTAGLVTGAAIGGWMSRHGEVFKFVEAVETAVRLGVAAHGARRALEHNPDLSPMQAVMEGAMSSRQMLDWSRRGSKMMTMTRLVPFLSSYLNGNLATLQQAIGSGDRGSAVSHAAQRQLQKYVDIGLKHHAGDKLSRDEQRDLADAYKANIRLAFLNMMLMMVIGLGMYSGGDDHEDITDEAKIRSGWILINGQWVQLPNPFELGFPSTVAMIMLEESMAKDSRFLERLTGAAYHQLSPTLIPTSAAMWSGTMGNTRSDGFFGRSRPVIGQHLQNLPPHEKFDAFTSELSIDFARALYAAKFPEKLTPSPKHLDFLISTIGGYWRREAQGAYENAKQAAGLSVRPERKATDLPIVRRFTGEPLRNSRSIQEVFGQASRFGGEMTRTAAAYKKMADRNEPDAAAEYLGRQTQAHRVFALIQTHGTADAKRTHPMQRASDILSTVSEVQRDIVADTLAPKESQGRRKARNFAREIELTPTQKSEALQILDRIKQVEARNAVVLLKRPGFENMAIQDPALVWDELKASNPQVHRHLRTLYDSHKIKPWASITKEWPRLNDRVQERGLKAF